MTKGGKRNIIQFKSLWEENENDLTGLNSQEISCPTKHYLEQHREFDLGKSYEYQAEKIYIRHICLKGKHSLMASYSIPKDYVLMIYCLKGECSYFTDPEEKALLSLTEKKHNTVYFGQGQVYVKIKSKDELDALGIFIRRDHFFRYTMEESTSWDSFKTKVQALKPAVLCPDELSIDYKISQLLHQILKEKLNPNIQNFFVDAKVTELMLYQFEQLLEKTQLDRQFGLSQEQVNQMHRAKDILIAQMKEPPTLKTLAMEVGTNEFVLKKHFKMIFGKSVFAYLLDYKMELAKNLLSNPNIKIADIAEQIGYKHPTHFSAAFKKHEGYLPKTSREKENDL